MKKPSAKDIIREFSRGNFRHVNDIAPESDLSESYCQAVVELAERCQKYEDTLRWITDKADATVETGKDQTSSDCKDEK